MLTVRTEIDFADPDEPTTTALVDALIEELERLPAQPSIAMRVVWIADDPGSSAKDLAGVIAADPSLTARVLKLANSAYYGLSGRVANVGFAVTVIGFPTVRAMATAQVPATVVALCRPPSSSSSSTRPARWGRPRGLGRRHWLTHRHCSTAPICRRERPTGPSGTSWTFSEPRTG